MPRIDTMSLSRWRFNAKVRYDHTGKGSSQLSHFIGLNKVSKFNRNSV